MTRPSWPSRAVSKTRLVVCTLIVALLVAGIGFGQPILLFPLQPGYDIPYGTFIASLTELSIAIGGEQVFFVKKHELNWRDWDASLNERFTWTTTQPNIASAIYQVSTIRFPTDPALTLNPPGLVASGPAGAPPGPTQRAFFYVDFRRFAPVPPWRDPTRCRRHRADPQCPADPDDRPGQGSGNPHDAAAADDAVSRSPVGTGDARQVFRPGRHARRRRTPGRHPLGAGHDPLRRRVQRGHLIEHRVLRRGPVHAGPPVVPSHAVHPDSEAGPRGDVPLRRHPGRLRPDPRHDLHEGRTARLHPVRGR